MKIEDHKRSIVSDIRRLTANSKLANANKNIEPVWEDTYMVKNSQTTRVVCKDCGAECFYSTNHLTRGKFNCSNCVVLRDKKNLDSMGYDYVLRVRSVIHARCRSCGNFCKISNSTTDNRLPYRCKGCLINKYSEILSYKECKFISMRVADWVIYVTYKNKSGDLFERNACSITDNRFATSKDGQWYDSHSTYLILHTFDGDTYCKIGTARIPAKRLRNLKLTGDSKIFVIGTFDTRFLASNLESELHVEFSDKNIPRDIPAKFTGAYRSQKDANGTRYKVKDGITEWFSSEVYETLKVRYNLT